MSPRMTWSQDKIARYVKNYKRIKGAKEVKLKHLQTYRHTYHIYYEDEGEIVAYQYLEKKIQRMQNDLCYLNEEYQAFKILNGLHST